MKPRFILQIVALFLVLSMVAALTLGIAGTIPLLVFWILAAFCVVIAYVLHGRT